MRSYSYGDPIKSINWKASARRLSVGDHTLLTNQYESEGRNTVWLFADCSAYMMVGNNLRNPMEVLAHLVTGASQYFLKRGYRVGLFPYGSNTAPLSPGIGRGQLMRISAAMRDLEPAEKAAELEAAIDQIKIELVRDSSSAVVFARLDMPDSESLLRGVKRLVSLRPRIRAQSLPLVIGVGGYLFIDADDWYERNGVLLMDMATRPLVRSLRKMGVRVLEWRPSDQPDWSEVAQEHARAEARE